MLEELEMGLRSHASFPQSPTVSIHPFYSLLQPQPPPAYLCSGIFPTLELASSGNLSKTPHCLPPWRPSQAKRPYAAWSCMEGHFPHLKKSTAMSRSSSRTTANLASCSGWGTTRSQGRLSHPLSLPPPSHFSGSTTPICHIRRIRPRERKSLLYNKTRLMPMFPLSRSKSFVFTTHRKQVESGSEAGLVVLGGE